MKAPKPHFAIRLLPSLTDVAFLLPLAFLFLRMDGIKGMLGDGDTGWHIRTGEWILAHHRVPSQDMFSYTKAGQPWFAWEWLWDAAFAWLHQRGGMAAVVLGSVFVICLTSVLLFRLIRRLCGNALIAIAMMFLVTGASAVHWLARPHLFTLLFTVIFFSLLERVKAGDTRWLWLLPVLTVLWTNLHGGFFVGLIMIGAYAGGEVMKAVFEAGKSERVQALRRSLPYLATAAASALATFINPYSYQLHLHLFEYLTDTYQYANIAEFQSFNFHHPVTFFFEPMLVMGLAAGVWSLARKEYVYTLLTAGWAHLALIAVRNAPLYVMIASVPVAMMIETLVRELPGKNLVGWLRRAALTGERLATDLGKTDAIPRMHLASAAAASLLIALAYAPHAPAACRAEYDANRYPSKAVDVLRRNQTAENIFTDDEWGGYLIYRLYPENKVFIDGRSDFYGASFNAKYSDVMNVRYDWEKNLDAYHVNTILLRPNASLAGTLKESRRWRPVYDDGVAIVFRATRETAAEAEQISAVSRDGKDRDRKITKSQMSDLTITKSNSRSEPS